MDRVARVNKSADSRNAAREPLEEGRGRRADAPTEVPKRGWWDILWRTKGQMSDDNLSIVAAGIAFYAFVAVVPALAATIAIYALFLDAAQVGSHLDALSQFIPAEVMPLLREQITRIANDNQAAGLSAVIGLLVALYGSAKATKALMMGLNIAYDETEKRSFIRLNAIALGITVTGIVGVIFVVTLLTAVPSLLKTSGLSGSFEWVLTLLRWPVLVLLFMTALGFIYRVGPCREAPKWRWLSGGAMAASLFWVLGSAAFSLYVSQFANYQETYGSLGAIVVFLLWLLLSAYVILLGAELNAEMERQTAKDTTTGEPRPLGSRGAYAADTVGPSRKGKSPETNRSPKSEQSPAR